MDRKEAERDRAGKRERSRVTLVISSLRMGGAERVAAFVANGLAAGGLNVRVVTLAPPNEIPFYTLDPRVALVNLDLAGAGKGAWKFPGRVLALRRALRADVPGMVLSFMHRTNVQVLLAMWGSCIPVVVSEQTNPWRGPAEKLWRVMRRAAYPRARAVIVLNDRCASYFSFLNAARVRVIPNPVFKPAVESGRRDEPRKPEILGLGRLDAVKRYDMLMRAFHAIASAIPGWRLVLFGDGPERDALERQRTTLGLGDRVVLAGVTRQPHEVMGAASIFALTSRYEGFPMALCEAMACGMAVVAMDCETGPRELIASGENGLLVPADDEQALADALLRLARDADLRAALGARAAEVVHRFDPAVVLRMWTDVLAEAGMRR